MGQAFHVESLDGGIELLTFDVPDQKVNTFSQPVLDQLTELVSQLEKRQDLRGLLLKSGKPGQFIAGADLRELGALARATPEQVMHGLERGHTLFDRVSRLPFPTVALIDGNCMGGGTELVLSMDYRLATTHRATRIGLPEVKVGLFPAWGGTQRLPRLIGIHHAIDIICSGDPVDGAKAASLGLVFDAVPAERLIEEGQRLVEHAHASGEWQEARRRGQQPLGLTIDQLQFAMSVAEGQIRGKTKGHYPAPLAALRAIREGINLPLAEGLQIERDIAAEVAGSPTSANLIAVFFMTHTIARNPGMTDPQTPPHDVGRVGVLGAGLMGAGIATAHARRGIPAAMVDVDNERVSVGLKNARKVIEDRIRIGRAAPEDLARMLAHLNTSLSHHAFADCDVVIEAVTENEALKTKLYAEMAPLMRDDAILASNTSTISITRMAKAAPDPARFVGMHFFSPVDRMALVEVVRGEKTAESTVATIVDLSKRIGKTPIVVNDCAGFLVNRVLLPYMNEALVMLGEGADMDHIDRVATRFGMPVGPMALHDMVGIDTSCFAGRVMIQAYSDRAVETPHLDQLVERGRIGKKCGLGFRKYTGRKGRPEPDPEVQPILEACRTDNRKFEDDEIHDRLFLAMLLEATRALEEQIVQRPDHLDMALILGVGFPPFRGGLLHWCDQQGAGNVLERAAKYAALGKRFEPTASLQEMSRSGQRFYPNGAT